MAILVLLQINTQVVPVVTYVIGIAVAVIQLYVTVRLGKIKDQIKDEVREEMKDQEKKIRDDISRVENKMVTREYLDVKIELIEEKINRHERNRNNRNT